MPDEKKVLIVDDDELLCYMLSANLRLKGWNPVSVGNFGSALVEAASGYELALLDLGLPDSPHLKTIENIFRLKKAGVRRVLVITGAPVDEAVEKMCAECGADGVMSKNASEFMNGLRGLFG